MSEPAKVLIDKDGFKWVLKDDGQYEWDQGYLHYSRGWLEEVFGPLTELKEEEEEVMSDVNMPEVLIDREGDRWHLQDSGYYSWSWGALYLDIEDLQGLHGPLTEPDKGVFKKPEQKQEEEEVSVEALLNKDGLPKVVIDRHGDAWTLWETDGKYHSLGEDFSAGLTCEPHVLEQGYGPLRLPGKGVFKMPEHLNPEKVTEPPYPGTIIEVDGEKYIRSDHETYPWIDLETGIARDWAYLVRQGGVATGAKNSL